MKYITIFSVFVLIVILITASSYTTSKTKEGLDNSNINTQNNTIDVSTTTENPTIAQESMDIQKSIEPDKIKSITPEISTKYNSDNLDMQYHDDLQSIGSNNIYNTKMGTAKVYDVKGDLIDVVSNAVQDKIVYYQPGSFKYGPTSYVPYYEDSVFLHNGMNAYVNRPEYKTSIQGNGICNTYKNDINALEEKCNSINNDTCAATTCCVLLGGQKCVAGDKYGPSLKSNYSDFMIVNKDFYYYQGKCHGNCPNAPQFPTLSGNNIPESM